MEKAQIRIVAGRLRGRKLIVAVHPGLRPTPQMVREALFSILGNAVPDRQFVDVFAGSGVVGLEAVSRGASLATLIERDYKLADAIERSAENFGVGSAVRIFRLDVYRWVERWRPPAEPVNVFLSPPFADLDERAADFHSLVAMLQQKLPAESVLTLQVEITFDGATLPDAERWEKRQYGRNVLLFWEPKSASTSATPPPAP
jgi:16S rRNA (guanine966-N2)-methyltransferase